MSPILQALASNATVGQILNYLSGQYPNMRKHIATARNMGYSENDIVDYLKSFSQEDFEKRTPKRRGRNLTQGEQAHYAIDERDEKRKNRFVQGAKLLGTLGAGYAFGRVMPQISAAIQGGLGGGNVPPPPPPAPGAPPTTGPVPGTPPQAGPPPAPGMQGAQAPGMAPNQPASFNPRMPDDLDVGDSGSPTQGPSQPAATIPDMSPLLDKMHKVGERAVNMLQSGNSPETVAEALEFLLTPNEKKWYASQTKVPFSEAAKQYVSKIAQQLPTPPQATGEQGGQPSAFQQGPSFKVPETGSVVVLPSGEIGTVKSVGKEKARVEVGNQIQDRPLDDLKAPENDFWDIKVDLRNVPEAARSAALSEVFADQDNSSLFVKYFQGHKPVLYKYFRKDGQPIEQSVIDRISQGLDIPVSSGRTFGGAWDTSTADSRGSANYKEIVKTSEEFKPGDEGNGDPNKPFWFVKLNIPYRHGYFVEYEKNLLKAQEQWNAKYVPKKPRASKKP